MFSLLILMLLRSGLIILLAYLLLNIPTFRRMLNQRRSIKTQLFFIFIFGLFVVISNFTGIEITNSQVIVEQLTTQLSNKSALANTRVLTIGVSGLIGGPFVGLSVGILSAIMRYFQGGAEVHIYVVSSILIGLFSGLYGYRSIRKNTFPSVQSGLVFGILMEATQMICILVLSSNLASAWQLVEFIAIPMMGANSIGTAIFLSIIETTLKQEEMTKAIQTQDVLELTNKTLPYFRMGLNEKSAHEVATIIKKFLDISAVSLTNQTEILAHVGVGSDHHKPASQILTGLSKEVLEKGMIKEVYTRKEINCGDPDCPLQAALVLPLKSKNQTVGTLKLYFTDANDLTPVERRLAEGLATIFSNQIELGERENESKLLKEAEIDSLQAQVSPHFLFNAMNTISSLIRIDSEKARKLVLELSYFLRANLQGSRQPKITLERELAQLNNYMALEFARFPDRYEVDIQVEDSLKGAQVPPFILQNLVENAFRHAFKNRKTGNKVMIEVIQEEHILYLSVADNGYGIPDSILGNIGKKPIDSEKGSGTALDNLNRRLLNLYGKDSTLMFTTSERGTVVTCRIPVEFA